MNIIQPEFRSKTFPLRGIFCPNKYRQINLHMSQQILSSPYHSVIEPFFCLYTDIEQALKDWPDRCFAIFNPHMLEPLMHQSHPLKLTLLSMLLIGLAGCSPIQALYEQGAATTAKVFSDPSKKEAARKIDRKLQNVDIANDRVSARTALIREMISAPDQA